jgi:hypothetical protein
VGLLCSFGIEYTQYYTDRGSFEVDEGVYDGLSKMPIRHLLMLAKFYGVSTDYILGVEEHKLDSGEKEDV